MKKITVVAAVWQNPDGRFFLAQRAANKSQAGLWEFPGGKVEQGEDEKMALARELEEELGIKASVNDFLLESIFRYSDELTIKLRFYRIFSEEYQVILHEHQDMIWATKEEIKKLNLSPADLPILKFL
jgi:(d)CTP diphosphatase